MLGSDLFISLCFPAWRLGERYVSFIHSNLQNRTYFELLEKQQWAVISQHFLCILVTVEPAFQVEKKKKVPAEI